MTQWTALAREHTRLRRESEALSRELAARLTSLDASFQEVDRLNHELRRQLESRGDKLATALAQRAALLGGFTVKPGDVLAERYEVRRQLGEGAMGTVFEAVRTSDGRKLAVKVVRSRGSTRAFARMAREAQLLARVKHPNVVEVLDVDVDVGGTVFFAMDYVEGKTLRETTDDGLALADAVDLLAQLAAGLAAIHAAQIVHRDLKPSNVLVSTSEGRRRVRIVDFGVSQQIDDSQSTATEDPLPPSDAGEATETLGLTRDGARVGTPLYMAPEVVAGGVSGFPSDVYAFGLIAVEVLTGRLPTTPVAETGLADARRDLAPRLAVLLDGCCRSDPAARPTARMLAETLADV